MTETGRSLSSTVRQRYDALAAAGEIDADPVQEQAAERFDRLLEELAARRLARKSSALGWMFARRKREATAPRGLYLYGPVGRGKTMLMDMFFALCPAGRKRRAHFHDFMADVHERIHAHRQKLKRGETREQDPIPPVAAAIADEAWVLCFDEFSVTDIADAMILSRLFEALFARGVVLVATSNVRPDDLYRDGLNRQLFLPFVDLLKRHVEVIDLDARRDYRLEKLGRLPVYLTPLDEEARRQMDSGWRLVVGEAEVHADEIRVKGHRVAIPRAAAGAARFAFEDLCAKPLGASDFLAIAHRYHTIFVDSVPVLDHSRRNEAKRFIILTDILYDNRIRLVLSAAAAPDALYVARRGTEAFEFARTASRLVEMQSSDYISTSRAAGGSDGNSAS